MNHYYLSGTSRGIGKALAEALLESSDNYVTGMSRGCSIDHERYEHIAIDLADLDAVKKFEFKTLDDAGNITLVNNSGTLGESKPVGRLSDEIMAQTFHVNLVSPAILMNRFIGQYHDHPGQKLIVNISSGAGKFAVDGWSGYCSTKAGLDMFSRVINKEQELSGTGFRILAVSPGIIETQMQEEIRQLNADDFSRVQDFVDYKEHGELKSAAGTARELVHLLKHPEKYRDVIVELRLLK